MNVVLDTSVVLKVVFYEPYDDIVRTLIGECVASGWSIVAPPIMFGGAANAIRRRMIRNRLSLAEALALLDVILQLPVTTVDVPEHYRRALTLTARYGLSTYDALYLTLAEALECDLWTGDERVIRALAGRERRVRWIGDFVTLEQQDAD